MRLTQWLKQHNAWFLGLSSASFVPGYLFKRRNALLGSASFSHYGQAWTRLGRAKSEFREVENIEPAVGFQWSTDNELRCGFPADVPFAFSGPRV